MQPVAPPGRYPGTLRVPETSPLNVKDPEDPCDVPAEAGEAPPIPSSSPASSVISVRALTLSATTPWRLSTAPMIPMHHQPGPPAGTSGRRWISRQNWLTDPAAAPGTRNESQELAKRFEEHEPDDANVRDAGSLRKARKAFQHRAATEQELAHAVRAARDHGHTWAAIGAMLGTSGEAARQRYGTPAARR